MTKTQKEILDDKLTKVAGGGYDEYSVNLLAGKMQKLIDLFTVQPLLSQLDCCKESRMCLEQAKDNLLNFNIESAYICTQEARIKISTGISSTPEHASLLENIEESFYSMIRTLGEFLD